MKRICLVTETYRPEINGVANTLGYWVDGMKSRGLSVQIIRPRQKHNDTNSQQDKEEQLVVRGLPIPGYKELKFGLPCKRNIRNIWKKNKPDAVYVATEGPLGLSAVRAAYQLNIPVISGFHTNFQSYSQFYGLGWLERIILNYLRYFHNLTLGTLAPTESQRKYLCDAGFKNVSVLSRGVDCEKYSPQNRSDVLRASWGVHSQDSVFLYVGRIAAEKNVELIGELSKEIIRHNLNAKFVFVGDGPLKATMENAHPHILFTGMKTGKDLATHYASADVFLFPSKTDTFGNVVTEAMASRLAIVSFDDAAAKEHLTDQYSALLSPLDNDDVYRCNLSQLAENPELIETLRENAFQLAHSISWEAIVDNLIGFLLDPESCSIERKENGHSKDITMAP